MTRGNQREVAREKNRKRQHEKGVVSLISFLLILLWEELELPRWRWSLQTVANLCTIWNRGPRTPCPAASTNVQESNRQPLCKRNSEKVQQLPDATSSLRRIHSECNTRYTVTGTFIWVAVFTESFWHLWFGQRMSAKQQKRQLHWQRKQRRRNDIYDDFEFRLGQHILPPMLSSHLARSSHLWHHFPFLSGSSNHTLLHFNASLARIEPKAGQALNMVSKANSKTCTLGNLPSLELDSRLERGGDNWELDFVCMLFGLARRQLAFCSVLFWIFWGFFFFPIFELTLERYCCIWRWDMCTFYLERI